MQYASHTLYVLKRSAMHQRFGMTQCARRFSKGKLKYQRWLGNYKRLSPECWNGSNQIMHSESPQLQASLPQLGSEAYLFSVLGRHQART